MTARPASLLASLRNVPLVCPSCRGELEALEEAFRCLPCARDYPLEAGIPDFRVFPDPYLGVEEDRRRTEKILAALDRPLEELLQYYWGLSDVTPELLRPRFVEGALRGEQKARRLLRILEDGTFSERVSARTVLEVGSGSGAFLAAAAPRFEQVIGVDIAMRWLHLSRRRFMERGLAVPPLVCCCAERLPFPDGAFDLAVMSATLEFARDQEQALSECARILKEPGSLLLSTVNRFSIAREPHVHLWGVGFLPRPWQAAYVRWRRGASFERIRLLSLRELDRMASRHFVTREYSLGDVPDETLAALSRLQRLQVRVYRAMKSVPPLSRLLRWIAPEWEVRLGKRRSQPPHGGAGRPL